MSDKRKSSAKTEFVKSFLQKFPNHPTMTLAKAIWDTKEGKLHFSKLESVRRCLRWHREEAGIQSRKPRKNRSIEIPKPNKQALIDILKSVEKPTLDFQMEYKLPKSIKKPLIIADLHVPFHDSLALLSALEYGKKQKCDAVIINGDFMDFAEISRFERDITKADIQGALDAGLIILKSIRKMFPKAPIIYKIGNHDDRLTKFVTLKAPQLKGLRGLTIEENLEFHKLHIIKVDSLQKIVVDGFVILHGHEMRETIMAPVNPARGLYLKAKVSALMSHCHRTSNHHEKDLNGEVARTYSTGCLCNLKAEYDPYNKWNHGFAILEIGKGVKVNNYSISKGVVE